MQMPIGKGDYDGKWLWGNVTTKHRETIGNDWEKVTMLQQVMAGNNYDEM